MALGPIITGARLSEDKVVGTIELSEGAGTDRVHGAGFEIDQNGTGNVLAVGGFIVVNIDALQLEIIVAGIVAGWVNAVLVRDDFPELGTDLVTALACLHHRRRVDKLEVNRW